MRSRANLLHRRDRGMPVASASSCSSAGASIAPPASPAPAGRAALRGACRRTCHMALTAFACCPLANRGHPECGSVLDAGNGRSRERGSARRPKSEIGPRAITTISHATQRRRIVGQRYGLEQPECTLFSGRAPPLRSPGRLLSGGGLDVLAQPTRVLVQLLGCRCNLLAELLCPGLQALRQSRRRDLLPDVRAQFPRVRLDVLHEGSNSII
jgi:hypothetical protein